MSVEKIPTNHYEKEPEDPRIAAIKEYEAELSDKNRMTPIVQEAIEKAGEIRRRYDTVFYLAGGLTGMSDEVKGRYGSLSGLIDGQEGMFGYAPHLHGTDPVKHPDVSPEEVRDIDYLFSAIVPDYHINCWHPVAHGNAVEAGWAEMAGIPAVHLVPRGVTLSRLVRGMRNIAKTIVYEDFDQDGLEQVHAFIAEA